MHNFSSIFKDANIRRSFSLFMKSHMDSVETRLFDRNGKPALKCLAAGKNKITKHEQYPLPLRPHSRLQIDRFSH